MKHSGERTMSTTYAPERKSQSKPRIVATYDYQDANGKLLFQVCRLEPKDFRQRRPDGKGGWTWKTKGMEKVLFRLPEILRAVAGGKRIFLCEGEKDVQAMVQRGLDATCNPGGAEKWQDNWSETLRGADVVIVADKDEAGRKHAQLVASKLHGTAKSVRVLEMPDAGGQAVKDAFDYFSAGGTAAQIVEFARNAPQWIPDPQLFNPRSKTHLHASLRNCVDCVPVLHASLCNVFSEDELVSMAVCKATGTSNRNLFKLARGILMLERERGGKLADEDLERIFEKWYSLSLPFLKSEESRSQYFEKFLCKIDAALRPLDENALKVAWAKSQTEPPPKIAAEFRSPTTRKLISFCYQLQLLAGAGNFYLSCRDAGRFLGISHNQGSELLNTLVQKKVLELVQKGYVGKSEVTGEREVLATEYRFKTIIV
jgi:hypothetical protein